MHWRPWERLIAAAFVVSPFLTGCNRQQESPPAPVPEVAVVTVQPQEVVLTSELPGWTTSYLVAEIRPQVSGLIKKRSFTEGSDVTAGQVLYEIDPAPFRAALENATANVNAMRAAADRARAALDATIAGLKRHQAILTFAAANRKRYENLVKTSAASAMQRDEAVSAADVADASLRTAEAQVESDRKAVGAAEAAIQQAEAALKSAQINLSYTEITAPISGRIGRSEVTVGAIATAYQPAALATIQQLDPIYVDVPQSTVALNRLKRSLANGRLKGNGTDRVKIVLEDGTPYSHAGSLKFRDVTVEPSTGSVFLRIVVPNPEHILLPHMFVRAIIDEGVNERAILVPQQAVSRDTKGNPIALIVDAEGVVQRRGLSTDRELGSQTLVSSGLAQGDRVIVEGMQRVRPGAVVKAVPFEDSPTNAAKPENKARMARNTK